MSSSRVEFRVIVGDLKEDTPRYRSKLANKLAGELRRIKLDVSLERTEGAKGTRGDPITIGTLLVAAASGGAVTALINLLGDWIFRNDQNQVEVEITKTPSGEIIGKRISVTGTGVSPDAQKEIIDKLLSELNG